MTLREVQEEVKSWSPEEQDKAKDATAELLALPGIHVALAEAEEDVKAGRLTPVSELARRTDVGTKLLSPG